MKKTTLITVLMVISFLSCNKVEKDDSARSNAFKFIKISKDKYSVLYRKKVIQKEDTFYIGAVLVKPSKKGKKIFTSDLTLSLCIRENLIAADFFQPSEYGRKKQTQKFEWPEAITKNKRHIATVDARNLGSNWKEKISKENYYSPFEF